MPVRHHNLRQNKGQCLVGAAAVICTIIAVGVLIGMLLLNSGLSITFQEKLGYIDNCAIQFAKSQIDQGHGVSGTKAFVAEMMEQMGLTPRDLTVDVQQIGTSDSMDIKITITNVFQLFGNSSVPATVKLSSAATQNFTSTEQ